MSTEEKEVFNFDITVKGTAKVDGEGENRKLVLESVEEASNINVYNDKGFYNPKKITYNNAEKKMSVDKFEGNDYKPNTAQPPLNNGIVKQMRSAIEDKIANQQESMGGRRTKAKRNKRKHRRTQYKKIM
jgi:hypothetical protein